MAGNDSFARAKNAREDEFYTQLTDIEKELRHYRQHFKGKTVLCNCDDPFESNFFKYFVLNFNRLGLKKLIATCYFSSPIVGQQFRYRFDANGQMSFSFGEPPADTGDSKRPYKAVVTQVYDKTGDGGVDMLDVAELFKSGENELTELTGNGDFRSDECLTLLDEADIVCTNPPFSLFREYVTILLEHGKSFVIIGSLNAITYKEIFPLLQDNKIWLGMGFQNGDAYFRIPEENARDFAQGVYNPESGLVHFRNCTWYTNLDLKRRHEEMILVKRYTSDSYNHYDNYDAIDVTALDQIPCDYAGVMGVPLTIMQCHNPDQFEIIGFGKGELAKSIGVGKNHRGRADLAFTLPDGKHKCPYGRILVRNKHPEPPRGGQQ